MQNAREIRTRWLDRARQAAGRWEKLGEQRSETARLLKEGGPGLADSPERVDLYRAREARKEKAYVRAGISESYFRERRIGPTLDLDRAPPSDAARDAGKPVARVVALSDSRRPLEGLATGFLIGADMLITNHHVFASKAETSGCAVQLGYEYGPARLLEGAIFEIDAETFFYADEELDFAVMAIKPASVGGESQLATFSQLALIPNVGKILVGQPISIIQYPDGGPKQYGVRNNKLLLPPDKNEDFLTYSTDTLPGSSGSPAFNKDWEVVAVHHSGVPEIRDGQIRTRNGGIWTRDMPDSDINWVANEGVRVSSVCRHLSTLRLNDAKQQTKLNALLATMRDPTSDNGFETSQGETSMPSTFSTNQNGIYVTVNGTANFYLGTPSQASEHTAPLIAKGEPITLVAPEKKLRFDPNYATREGYDDNFLEGFNIPLPKVSGARMSEVLVEQPGTPRVLKYHHFSLVMNAKRKLTMWSATNVDYSDNKRWRSRDEFGTDTWIPDPRIPGELQIQDPEFYAPAEKFDRGHIVRREDNAWGDDQLEEEFANSDTFHWTNCTPQHERFNRDAFGYKGLWGKLENHIKEQAAAVGNRMTIFAGPILDNAGDLVHDFGAGDIQLPLQFWKVVVVIDGTGAARKLRAYGFILDQKPAIDQYGLEGFRIGEFSNYHVALNEITADSGVVFPQVLLEADLLHAAAPERRRVKFNSLENVRVR